MLKSKRAFDSISFLSYEKAEAENYFNKKKARDLAARREYRRVNKENDNIDDIYMIDIMRGGFKNGDAFL